MPLREPIELARMIPLVLMTESTTVRAAAAVSSTRPPFALSVPFLVLLTSDLSGRPVATSMTLDEMWSPTASVISLSPYMSRVKLLPEASATVPSSAVMVPELRTPGATSAANPPLVAVIRPRLTIDASGRPGMLKFIRPAMKSSFLMSLVVARKPAVLMTAPLPNRMPSRLMRKMRPFAVSVPRICDGPSPPVTRLSATDELLG